MLPWCEAVPHMNKYSNMLRISGYDAKYRALVIKGAINRMKEVRQKVKNGVWASQYRDRSEINKNKIEKGGNSSATWFLKWETTATITCTATPGSILKKEIEKKINNSNQADKGRTMVVDDGGLTTSNIGSQSERPI